VRLAQLLGVSPNALKDELRSGLKYREWDEEKASGGFRHIEDPNPKLKGMQEKLARLLMQIEPPEYLMCPAKGRSTFDNALVHAGSRVVRNIDIRSYFPSTPEKRVMWFFRAYLQCSRDVAYQLTKLSCLNGHLPTGSPLSPILSHFAFRSMWDELASLCRENGIKFTVWIDDITLSGSNVPGALLWQIKKIIAKNELRYHKQCQYFDSSARITGLIARSDKSICLPHRHFLKLY
jgi:hypothetical protein